ncbi:MAG: transglutaminase-like domain-containing protein [Brevefilum sp.]
MKSTPFPLIGRYRFGWGLFLLAAIMLVLSLTVGMNESIRDFSFTWMSVFGIIAIITGWIFSGGQRRAFIALASGVCSGLILLVLINSGGYTNLFRASYEGFKAIRLALPYQIGDESVYRIIIFLNRLIADLSNYSGQTYSWLSAFLGTQNNHNPAVSRTFWGFLLWAASFTTGWFLRRKNHAFIASLPILALLAGILGYTRQNTSGLVMGLSFLLLMIVLIEHLTLENKWRLNQIDFSEEIRFDIISLGIPIIIVIMAIAGILPNLPYDEFREFFNRNLISQESSNSQFDESLGLETTPRPQFPNDRSGSLPRAFLIGAGPELSENLIMEIDTGEFYLPPELEPGNQLPKYYWFGRSYDIYTGNGWETSEISLENVPKNEVIIPADPSKGRILHQNISKTTNASPTLYSSGLPQSVDHQVIVGWRESTSEYYSAQLDALAYEVESFVLEISQERLMEANQEAPQEIVENYLEINEATPQRVHDLALSITEGLLRPYEKAKAIESYLRQFEYTLDIPSPPEDEDIVDYFLFDLQKGYCDYFASSMVILARAVGLPARLAVGYTAGEYDHNKAVFVVTEANAHAWPEVYISPYGWIPFEPTASESPFSWDTLPSPQPGIDNDARLTNEDNIQQPFWPDLLILLGVINLFIFIFFFGHKFINFRSRQTSTNQQIENIHQQMKRHLKRLFTLPQSAKTPLEFQNGLIDWLNHQKSSRLVAWLTQEIIKTLQVLTTQYHQGIYTPRPLTKDQIKTAQHDLAKLMAQSWILNFVLLIKGH